MKNKMTDEKCNEVDRKITQFKYHKDYLHKLLSLIRSGSLVNGKWLCTETEVFGLFSKHTSSFLTDREEQTKDRHGISFFCYSTYTTELILYG